MFVILGIHTNFCRSFLFLAGVEWPSPNECNYLPLCVGATSTCLHLLSSFQLILFHCHSLLLLLFSQGGRMLAAPFMPCLLAALQQKGQPHVANCVYLFGVQKNKVVKPWYGHSLQDQTCCLHAALPALLCQLMLFCSQVFSISKKREIPGENFINVLTNANIFYSSYD